MPSADQVFAVPVFLVVFREALETVIIVSVLLAFLKQTLNGPDGDVVAYKKLVRQVWFGTGIGGLVCLIVGGALIGVFYTLGANKWDTSEFNYEGAFSLVAAVIISVVGVALLRVAKMQEKWRVKLAAALQEPVRARGSRGSVRRFFEKYTMFMLPFITVLREGIEAIVFVAGVTFSAPATAVPLPVVAGLLVGAIVGYILYKSGASTRLQVFLVISTCILYLVAAGLFSRGVWSFEQQVWQNRLGTDAAELGDGPGSYDVSNSVWHVNCCSPYVNGGGGWGFLNAILGWNNSATYGSVISYNVYWLVLIVSLITLRYREVNGRWPLPRASLPARTRELAVPLTPVQGHSRNQDSADESTTNVGSAKSGGSKRTVTATATESDGATILEI